MANNLVPRANEAETLGTTAKRWLTGYFGNIDASYPQNVSICASAETATQRTSTSNSYVDVETFRVYIKSGAKLLFSGRIQTFVANDPAYARVLIGSTGYAEISKATSGYAWVEASSVAITETGWQDLKIQIRTGNTEGSDTAMLKGHSILIY
jgi:aspartate/tyrosine/aromatic aminotransferase